MPTTRDKLLDFALSLPQAYEDHPWGETVAKVNKKVFVFFGQNGLSLKLEDSHGQAMLVPDAAPTGYGLGRSGWVSLPLKRGGPPLAVLKDWVEESYRLVAPKKLASLLDD